MSNLEKSLEQSLTVKELLSALASCDPDAKVVFAYNYGDHWKTLVAPGVVSVARGAVSWSEYHRMPIFNPVDDEDDADDCTTVVVLS